jgi:hypothetical protein
LAGAGAHGVEALGKATTLREILPEPLELATE